MQLRKLRPFWTHCLLLLSLSLFLISCKAPPRPYPIASRDTSKESLNRYVEDYENAPELASRERTLIERRQELRLNWSINRALEKGSVRVRAITPPLQLTGDTNIDQATTYRILLVADDLLPGHKFDDEYEVRIGPDPTLATITPGATAASLEAADVQYAEERLRLLRLDANLLSADYVYMTNYLNLATNRLKEVGASLSNTVERMKYQLTNSSVQSSALRSEYNTTFTNAQALESQILSARQVAADGKSATNLDTTALQNLLRKHQEAQAKIREIESQEYELGKYTNRLMEMRVGVEEKLKRLDGFVGQGTSITSALGAQNVQIDFWSTELDALRLLAQRATQSAYTIGSAVTVAFRGEALARLTQLTIEVVRRIPKGLSDGPESEAAVRIKADLKETQDRCEELRKYLVLASSPTMALRLNPTIQHSIGMLVTLQGRLQGDGKMIEVQFESLTNEISGLATNIALAMPILLKSSTNVQNAIATTASAVKQLAEAGQATLKLQSVGQSNNVVFTNLSALKSSTETNSNLVSATLAELSQLSSEQSIKLLEISNLLTQLPTNLNSAKATFKKVTNQLEKANRSLVKSTDAGRQIRRVAEEITSFGTNLTGAVYALTNRQNDFLEAATSASNSVGKADSLISQALKASTEASQAFSSLTDKLNEVSEQAKQLVDKNDHNNRIKLQHHLNTLITDTVNNISNYTSNTRTNLKPSNIDQSLTSIAHARSIIDNITLQGNDPSLNFFGSGYSGANVGRPGEYYTDPEGTFARLERGDVAMFRINVLRGIVGTTAFLLPDDAASKLFGSKFCDQFFVAQVTFRNPNSKPILVYGNTMRLIVRMTAASMTELDESGQHKRLNWWGTYEPMNYENVHRVLQQSNERTWRKWISKGIDYASMAGGVGAAFSTSLDLARGVSLFSGTVAPATKRLLEEDLIRYEKNFLDLGLNNIEEIAAGGILTRHVFLPKGPIFGDHDYDPEDANNLPETAKSRSMFDHSAGRASDFGKVALRPSFIYNVRREEVYVEGKRILQSDALSSAGVR